MALNGKNNVAMKELLATVSKVCGQLKTFGSNSGSREMFLAEFGPAALESAESEYRTALKTLAEKQFGRQGQDFGVFLFNLYFFLQFYLG